jgi:hypothetical protein
MKKVSKKKLEKAIKEDIEWGLYDKTEPLAKEFFGRLKGKLKQSTQEIKDEIKKGWN